MISYERTAASPSAPSPAGAPAHSSIYLTVQTRDGQRQRLEFAGISEAEAVRRAGARGMRVLAVESAAPKAAAGGAAKGGFPLVLFSQELLALLDAGLNLTEALSTLYAKEAQPGPRAVLGTLLQSLREGRNFSDVLAAAPQHFSDVYVATVRAAERTGGLPQALTRYIAYQSQFDTLRKKLVSAAIYPVMLLVVGGFVTLFLLGYVVPRFSVVYESSGREIPWLSAMLLACGKMIYNHWQIALGAIAAGVTALVWAVSRPQGRAWLLATVLGLPWLARKADQFRLARFYRAVSLLLASGISLPRAMGMVSGLLGPRQQVPLRACRQAIEEGQSLSLALARAGLSSAVADSLIQVGERSGQLADMLERTARFADDDFSRWVDWASRLLEPMLMVVIGLVIGTVVVLMYMPIFELAGSLQ
ncbi:MAG: type II secretion system F family protein [Pseudomonadota bacterium]